MSQLTLEIPDDVAKRYDEIADKLNVSRAKSGQAPITGVAVMQIVLAKFVGLTAGSDVDLGSVLTPPTGDKNVNDKADMWTPPHGGVVAPAADEEKAVEQNFGSTTPHGGIAPTTGEVSKLVYHRPHGG